MRTFIKAVKAKILKHRITLSIIGIYGIANVIMCLIFYPILPKLLNYAPGMLQDEEVFIKMSGITYNQTYLILASFLILAGTVFLTKALKGVDKWESVLEKSNGENNEEINAIRKKCINSPYIIYTIQIFFPVIAILLFQGAMALFTQKAGGITTIKAAIMIMSFVTLPALISQIMTKRMFRKILIKTYNGQSLEGTRIGLTKKIFLQILPLFIVAVLFTSLVGYSRIIDEKGTLLFNLYKSQLVDEFSNNTQEIDVSSLGERLKSIGFQDTKKCGFIITPGGEVITSNGSSLNDKFLASIKYYSPISNGRVQESSGEMLGAVININSDTGTWTVGVEYIVVSNDIVTFFLSSFIFLMAFCSCVLLYFSKSLAGDISIVTKSLHDISEGGDIGLEKRLSITSNDEIGDLVISFNRIQQREKEYIKTIQDNQAILMERERLASLGQMIGGIAHNLNSPIMSISGGIEGLRYLILEYKESIEDMSVTKEDHYEIAKEMATWIDKIKPYCTYMSDIIASVKGQAVQLSSWDDQSFTIYELVKRIDTLMEHELKNHSCSMIKNFQIDLQVQLNGEVNSLVQVINNLIVNAIDSYEGKGGIIEFVIYKKDSVIKLIIKDNGKGIPKDVQERLFKEMITTKGANGTGLGLYMAYSTIKGRFGGNMRFESEEGKGTAFYVSVQHSDIAG